MRVLGTPLEAARWLSSRVGSHPRGRLRTDSRQVRVGEGFIAWPGATTDGRRFVDAALGQGAAACLVEAAGAQAFFLPDDDAVAGYQGLKRALGPIAAAYYDHPTEQLPVLAVTGTNGKTSVAWWLAQALSRVRPGGCAVVGTLGVGRPPHLESTGMTTPDAVLMQAQFRRFLDEGLAACAIEASSIGIEEGRLDATRVRVAVFTNFTRDHLDYHGTMQAYWEAKERLFRWPGLEAAVVNIDDPQGRTLAESLDGGLLPLWTYSCTGAARLQARDIRHGDAGLAFQVCEGEQVHDLHTQLVGQYNVSNLLAVIGALRAVGIPLADAVQGCQGLLPVPGRMERLGGEGRPLVAVDYAHTPDALEQALAALRPLARARGGRLWCVFGCGGDRDATKRPMMAAVAEKGADCVVVTSDNPRAEKPLAIISQILLGLSHRDAVQVEVDRARAIEDTIASADARDVILLAGKGHETYQEAGGVRQPFDDREHARLALNRRSIA